MASFLLNVVNKTIYIKIKKHYEKINQLFNNNINSFYYS